MRRSLARQLAGYFVARSATDAAAYLAYADASSAKWVAPEDDARWNDIIHRYTYVTDGKSPRRTDPREALATILEHALNKEGARIGSISTGPSGARLLVRLTRTVPASGQSALKDPDDVRYWVATSTRNAHFFRTPPSSLAQVLDRYKQVVVAETLNVVRIRNDSPSIIWGFWFWDPDRREWQCSELYSKGYYLNDLQF